MLKIHYAGALRTPRLKILAGRTGEPRPSLKMISGPRMDVRELLMDWPIGRTALEPLAMDKFHQWLDSHGKF